MSEWAPIVAGIAAQTLITVWAAFRLHGSIMRKIGEFELKVETLWDEFIRRASQ